MISQFYVISPRGDTIINRDFRGDIVKGTAEIFFRRVKSSSCTDGHDSPIFNLDGINYIYIKRYGLYFVATTYYNVAPSFIVEVLQRTTKVFKDFCGVLNEEAIRKNFALLYEVLDEMIDFGYPQLSNTESLKAHIHNEAVLVDHTTRPHPSSLVLGNPFPTINPKTLPANASHRPIRPSQNDANRKNEIFVDILERLSLVMNSSGNVLNSCIDGSIQMKSYLTGTSELRLALNEDLCVKNMHKRAPTYGAVVFDDCNFHESVDTSEFEDLRTITFRPPDGEFTVMNYRITGEFRVPFRIFPILDQSASTALKKQLVICLRSEISENSFGGNVLVTCPMPKHTSTVSCETDGSSGQTAEYSQNENRILWNIKKFVGNREMCLRCRITLTQESSMPLAKDIGPIGMNFEIPMYNVSNLQVRFLRVSDRQKALNPFRWVRYVTQSSSYVCRL